MKPDVDVQPPKLGCWLTFAVLIVLLIFLAYGSWLLFVMAPAAAQELREGKPFANSHFSNTGQLGDSFGVLNALFSGLAFSILIVTLLFQRRDLEASLFEIKKSVEAQRELAESAKAELEDVHRGRQIQLSMELQDRFYGGDFVIVRSAAWEVKQNYWDKTPASHTPIVKYWFDDFDPADTALPPATPLAANRLTPLQNLALLVNFWHRIVLLDKRELIDRGLVEPLRHEYVMWQALMGQLSAEIRQYREVSRKPLATLPDWVTAVDELNSIFG